MPTGTFPSDKRLIVGRGREQQLLRVVLERALEGHGTLVLVSGEAGIGKTTLIDDLTDEAAAHGALVLHGGCYDLTTTAPYAPWSDAIRRYAPSDGAPPVPAWFTDPAALQAVGSQAALFDETRRFFAELAAYQPVVIVLEDLHWADLASLEALRYLARELTEHAILLLVSFRDDELTRRHELFQLLPLLVRESRAQRVHPGQLDRGALHQLIQSSFPLDDLNAARLTEYVWQRSEGNPFFTSELLQGLEDERVLLHTEQGWALGDLARVDIPPLLRQVLTAQLDRLRPETRAALQVAAIIGQAVSIDVWQTVAEMSEAELETVLAEALEARLIQESPGGEEMYFRHALLREALYSSLIASRRRVVHRRIGEVLAGAPQPDPDEIAHHFRASGDPRAAQWIIRAGIRASSNYASRVAADQFELAQALLEADPDAVQQRGWLHLEIGHQLRYIDRPRSLAHLEEAGRLAIAAGDPVLLSNKMAMYALLRCVTGDLVVGVSEMGAAHAAMNRISTDEYANAHTALAALFPEELSGHGFLLAGKLPNVNVLTQIYVLWLAIVGRYMEAIALGEQHVSAVASSTDDILLIQTLCRDAYFGLAHATSMVGKPLEAHQWAGAAIAAYDAVGHYPQVRSTHWISVDLLLNYDTDRPAARRLAMEAALTAAPHWSGTQVDWLGLGGWLDLLEGRWARAHDQAIESRDDDWDRARRIRIQVLSFLGSEWRRQTLIEVAWEDIYGLLPDGVATEQGSTMHSVSLVAQRVAAELTLDAGQLEQARAWLEMHDHWLDSSSAVLGRAESRLLWARYHLDGGELDQSEAQANAALEQADDPRQPLSLVAAHRLLGRLATRRGRFEEAAEHLSIALDSATICELPFEIALTQLAQAELAIATHATGPAHELLASVRAVCEALGAQRTLAQVAELEAQLSNAARRTRYPAGLTQREVDVLRLVAGGLTDAEVAEELYLSPRTVSSYLSSVFNKLGVSSRTAAAAFAIREGLV